jgi:hypothetical protein
MYNDLVYGLPCSSSTSSCSGVYDEIARMFAEGNASISLQGVDSGPHIESDGQRYAIPPAVFALQDELQHRGWKGTVCVHVNDRGEIDGLRPIYHVQNRAQHVAQHFNTRMLYLTSELPEREFGVHLGNGPIFGVHF